MPPDTRELKCSRPKPKFGDLFQIFGAQHPDFPAENNYASLQGWEIEQTDDYFAWHQQGDPAIWIFPVVRGEVVHHHPGPYDALRIQLVQPKAREAWTALCEALATVLDH